MQYMLLNDTFHQNINKTNNLRSATNTHILNYVYFTRSLLDFIFLTAENNLPEEVKAIHCTFLSPAQLIHVCRVIISFSSSA